VIYSALRWLPAPAAALLWVWLAGLVQPLLSPSGALLWTDAALLLAPARFFPRTPAVLTVLVAGLFADATRGGPFGLSASVLLPVLLVLLRLRPRMANWDAAAWTGLAAAINSALLLVCSAVWTLDLARDRAAAAGELPWTGGAAGGILLGALCSIVASSCFILVFGRWFMAFQVALLRAARNPAAAAAST